MLATLHIAVRSARGQNVPIMFRLSGTIHLRAIRAAEIPAVSTRYNAFDEVYGAAGVTCTNSAATPASILNSSVAMWFAAPLPPDA